jgi:hypothetical protein
MGSVEWHSTSERTEGRKERRKDGKNKEGWKK